jgi:triosephosphate isomerase
MKRIKIVAGNWKMNKTFQEADELVSNILDRVEDSGKPADVDIVLCTPHPYLELARDLVEDFPVYIGAQDASEHEWGAYTGEVSAAMLASMGIEFCILGHSERRKYFGEDDELLLKKVRSVLAQEIIPIFCCGEVLEEREKEEHFKVVEAQLVNTLFQLDKEDFRKVVIAYEPVWAIGTGKTATPGQAQEMHAFIRKLVSEKMGEEAAAEKIILYGGSCNSGNAGELFDQADVDGGLIGGASLEADEFYKIIQAAGV